MPDTCYLVPSLSYVSFRYKEYCPQKILVVEPGDPPESPQEYSAGYVLVSARDGKKFVVEQIVASSPGHNALTIQQFSTKKNKTELEQPFLFT